SLDSEAPWTLRVEPKKLVLESGGTAGCCGEGWRGMDTFQRASWKAPVACKVKAPRAYFHASDAENTQRKAFVVEGDSVQVYVPDFEPALVPARFVAKRTTVGLLKREELDCAAPGGPAASAPVD